ncbi:unnamed protein product [Periconia digitata]|uniref:Uncharacterized protein n=1 Tax=Periconia digitata TaxID=1303443 RepID=A0A9W4US33_9PLEO|nr:unnamed protein product [Periconia digitata]
MIPSVFRFITLSIIFIIPTITTAATLPARRWNRHAHRLLETRDTEALLSDETQPNDNDPQGFFQDISDLFEKYNILDFWRDLFGTFSKKDDGKGGKKGKTTTTIYVTPSPIEVKSTSVSIFWASSTTETSSNPGYYTTTPPSLTPTPTPTSSSPASSSSAGYGEDGEDDFHILPYFPSTENISDNVTYPTPTSPPATPGESPVVIVISDDFPNEPAPTPPPTFSAIYNAVEEIASILPYFPAEHNSSVNLTTSVTEYAGIVLSTATEEVAPTPTTGYDVEEEEPIFSILPWYPAGENLTDNVTDGSVPIGGYGTVNLPTPTEVDEPEVTPSPTAAYEEEEPIFSILPWYPAGENLTDNVTLGDTTSVGGYDNVVLPTPTEVYESEETPPSPTQADYQRLRDRSSTSTHCVLRSIQATTSQSQKTKRQKLPATKTDPSP